MRTWTKAFLSLGVVAGGCVTAVAIGAAQIRGLDVEFLGEPSHLKPIAVPPRACPALGQVRVAAAAAGEGWLDQRDERQWSAFRTQLAPKLDRLVLALDGAIPVSPPPIAARFERIRREVLIGQRELPRSTDLFRYLTATDDAVLKGERSLREASDLVGNACGAALCR